MKAKTVSVALFHFHPGHHKYVNTWYDEDHRPEVHGTVPHLYHSQRYVAPPDYVAARPPTDLPFGGGEYVTLYWSEGTPEQIQYDISVNGGRLEVNGRSGPMRHLDSAWRQRTHVVTARTRPDLELSPDAVPIAPHTAIMLSVGEVVDLDRRDDYGRWHEMVHIPELLSTNLFRAFFRLRPASRKEVNLYAHLYYIDSSDPLKTFAEYQRFVEKCKAEGRYFKDIDSVRRHIFTSLYRPIVPGQYDFYD